VPAPSVASMKIPADWLVEDVHSALGDPYVGKFSPVLLHGAVLSLTGGTLPRHLIVRARLGTGVTQWRAAWLEGTTIGYASLTADVEGWGSYYEDDHGPVTPQETIAWIRPLSSVVKLSLTNPFIHTRRWGPETHWHLETGTRLEFSDGEALDLPLFGKVDSPEEETQLHSFLTAVRSALAGREQEPALEPRPEALDALAR
jgi:hypothetical protein